MDRIAADALAAAVKASEILFGAEIGDTSEETFRDVVELLVPELQKRGVFKQEYREGTLREKLFGGGPRLAAPHPGASYRRDARTAASVEEKVT